MLLGIVLGAITHACWSAISSAYRECPKEDLSKAPCLPYWCTASTTALAPSLMEATDTVLIMVARGDGGCQHYIG
jgi:hypothetical protein